MNPGDLVETINPEQYGVTYVPAGERFTLAGPAFFPEESECRSTHGTVMYIRTDNLRVVTPVKDATPTYLRLPTPSVDAGQHSPPVESNKLPPWGIWEDLAMKWLEKSIHDVLTHLDLLTRTEPPRDHPYPKDPAHDRVHDVIGDIASGKVTGPARNDLRKALDTADAGPVGRAKSDGAVGRAVRMGP